MSGQLYAELADRGPPHDRGGDDQGLTVAALAAVVALEDDDRIVVVGRAVPIEVGQQILGRLAAGVALGAVEPALAVAVAAVLAEDVGAAAIAGPTLVAIAIHAERFAPGCRPGVVSREGGGVRAVEAIVRIGHDSIMWHGDALCNWVPHTSDTLA